ncbi:hypothetical protein ACNVED_16185 (plasmid) [Legionella sp. D16C41]
MAVNSMSIINQIILEGQQTFRNLLKSAVTTEQLFAVPVGEVHL